MSRQIQDKETLGKRAIMNAFIKLDYRGIKEYEDRLWGKAKETIDLDANLKSEIETNIVFKFSKKEIEEYVKILIENGIIKKSSTSKIH